MKPHRLVFLLVLTLIVSLAPAQIMITMTDYQAFYAPGIR